MTGRAFFALVQTFFAITPALIYLAAGYLITGGISSGSTLTAGTLVAFTTLQARLQMPLLQLMRVTLDVQTSLALFRRIFEYLDLEPAITSARRPAAAATAARRARSSSATCGSATPSRASSAGARSGSRFGLLAPTTARRAGRSTADAADRPRTSSRSRPRPERLGAGGTCRCTVRAGPAGGDRRPVRQRARRR